MTNDRDNVLHTKSVMMAFGHMRHKVIVFVGIHAHTIAQPNLTKACTSKSQTVDTFMGFTLYYK